MTARLLAAPVAVQRLALAVVALLFFLPGFATLPVTDRDEARFTQASLQMVKSGDPIDIRFQDEPRYKKPVGIYWLQAAAMLASGQGSTAPVWVQRLPSLAGAVTAVVLVQVVGTPLVGAASATLAALVFSASLVLAGEARIAKTDAVLLALTLGAMAVLSRAWMRRHLPRWQVFAFWVCLGAAALVKGPIGPMVVGLAALSASLLARDGSWLRPLAQLPAVALGIAIVLPWLVAITLKAGPEFWSASVGTDLLAKVQDGQEGKGAPPGTYLALVWITFWPGSLLLALGLPMIWASRGRAATRFLLAWLIPCWIVFELVPTKLIHYPLPLYPALALLALAAWQDRPASGRIAQGVAILFLAFAPALLGAAIYAAVTTGVPRSAWPAALALPVALAAAALLFRALPRAPTAVPVLVAVLGATTLAGTVGTLARVPYLWPSESLAPLMQAARPDACPAAPLISVGYSEPSLIRLTSRETVFLPAAEAAARFAQGCAVVAVEDRAADEFKALVAPATPEPAGRVTGFAIGAGRAVGLTVYSIGPRS